VISYKNYISRVTPKGGVFSIERKELGIVNNSLKWFGLRVSYLFYIIGVSPNILDLIGMFFALIGYFLFVEGFLNNLDSYVFIGWLFICFQVLIDYMDGAIAKAIETKNPIGTEMDNIGLDLSKSLLFVVLGILTNESIFILINVFSSTILLILFFNTFEKIPDYKLLLLIKNFVSGRRSILGIRFMLGVIPILLMISYFSGINMEIVGIVFSLFYLFFALVWLLICIPTYDISNSNQT